MRTRIISAFPGSGKTYFHLKHSNISIDSDSSLFSWTYLQDGTKVRNTEFPINYIQHIKENIGKHKYIFVSTHKEVRDALKDHCIFFYLVFPGFAPIEEYVKRYKARGSSPEFIQMVRDNWMSWNQELYFEKEGCEKCILGNKTIEEFITELEEKEQNL